MTVLALRAAGLGDLLTAVPALRALSQSGPADPRRSWSPRTAGCSTWSR